MGWSMENETYCDFWSSYGGAYKAPEEFIDRMFSNEGVDTWALGHGIFGLLTGLFPFYRTVSHSTIRKMVAEGHKPFVDPRYRTRSMVEGRLVEIMEQCWEFYSSDRPTTFAAVEHIAETKRLYAEEQGQEQAGHRNLNTDAEMDRLQNLAETRMVDQHQAKTTAAAAYGTLIASATKEDGTHAEKETSAEILKRLTSDYIKKTHERNTIQIPGLE
jgi:hypothetical protein